MTTERRLHATDGEVARALRDLDKSPRRVGAGEWPAGLHGLGSPGLYSWWVDGEGAEALTKGLGASVLSGRIYAGQTGATKWPSGQRGSATLSSRIGGNHLAGTIRASTFRRTLAASLLRSLELELVGPGKLAPGSEKRLSAWMCERLEVAVHPFPEADALADLERRVLAVLDPPLNLDGVALTPVRERLRACRIELGRPAQTLPRRWSADRERQPPPATSPESSPPTLHGEILSILETNGGGWMTTSEIAAQVNERSRYRKQDSSAVTRYQVARRVYNYPTQFEIDGSRVRPAVRRAR